MEWSIEHASGDPVREPRWIYEIGEPVTPRLAMPLNLFPVDINVGQFSSVECIPKLVIALAGSQDLDNFWVKDRIEGHGVIEVEDRRLANE